MPWTEQVDDRLLEFCKTDAERSDVKAVLKHGSIRAAARGESKHFTTVRDRVKRVKARAAIQGWSPEHDMVHAAPDTHILGGDSTLYDSEGKMRLQWVKRNIKQEEVIKAAQEFIKALAEDVKPAKAIKPPKTCNDDLLAVYPIGDPHVGMYAWHEETGENFDLDIAASDLHAAMSEITRSTPAASTAVVVNLGDFFHADDATNRTPRGQNALDVDGRFSKVIRVGCQILVGIVQHALKRHGKVVLRNEIGNHDPHGALWLPVVLEAYFKNEPRVEVVMDPTPFWYYRHGKTLIGTTHGHGPKPKDLPGIMATDRPQDWGESEFRYWVHGHIHSQTKHEFPGCTVESFRTLAGKDYWHTAQGYRSGQDINSLVLHKDYGEIARHKVGIIQARDH
jgi:hypothetical protein